MNDNDKYVWVHGSGPNMERITKTSYCFRRLSMLLLLALLVAAGIAIALEAIGVW